MFSQVSNPDLAELNNPDLPELKYRSSSSRLIKQGLPLKVAISSSSLILCSHTIFEDATPELCRDFLWDGDFRLKWDPMLAHSKTLDEIPQNGATVPLDKKRSVQFLLFLLPSILNSQFQQVVCFPVFILLQ